MATPKFEPMNKYLQCNCEKQQMILVGIGMNIYVNAFALVITAALFIPVTISILQNINTTPASAYILLGLFPLYILILRGNYSTYFIDMIKAGHTDACSKKIALKGMWYQWRGSNFRIGVNPKEIDPQGDYGTPVMGLWFLAFFGNLIYLGDFTYGKGTLILYPILFTIVIVGSARLIRKIKNMTRTIYVFCILNIVSSGLFFLLYLIYLIAKLG